MEDEGDYADEQLDFGDEGNDDEEEEQLLGEEEEEDEAAEAHGAYGEQEAEEDELQGLEDADMQDADQPAAAAEQAPVPHQEQQDQQRGGDAKQQQDGQDGKASKGPKLIDLTKPSNRLERIQQPRGQQQQQHSNKQQPQQPQQQQPTPPKQQQPPQKQQQQQPNRAPPIPRPVPSNRLRGAVRYFMLRSVNSDNWQLAQQEGAWATQPRNEERLGAAFREGQEVVLFMSVTSSGAIQGYGRMTSLPGKAPQAPWLDIDYTKVNNFYVSWDCTAPITLESVRELRNPWNDVKLGAHSKGAPLPLSRHRDGHELAPQVGEQLIDAMNRNAARVGHPATGLLAEGVPAARRRGAALGPAAAGGGGPAWQQQQQQQHRQGLAAPQQQQMHMQQQRMLAMQQQQQQRGGMGGRGMMGPGPGGPIGQHGRQMGPGGRMMQQQQPPPPGPRPANAGGHRAGGPLVNDPRLNPRFAGRLKMDGLDDLPAANVGPSAGRGGQQHSPPAYGRGGDRDDWERERERGGGGHYDGRGDRRYEREQDGDWDEGGRQQQGQHRHGSRGRRRSRSRSRSPPRAADSSRGGSTGRVPGGGGVAESSWGFGGSSPEQRRRQQEEEEPESIQDMSYEQYLAAYERVQVRIAQLKQVTGGGGGSSTRAEPQLQLALLPGPPPQPPQRQQQMAGAMGMRGTGGVRGGGGGMMGGDGGRMGGGMMAGGGANGDAAWPGPPAAAAGGAVGPGRPVDNPAPKVPTLAE